MEPEIRIELFEMDDPTFEAGSSKTAHAVLTNPTEKEFTYDVELYLSLSAMGMSKVVTSGIGQVTIPGGGSLSTYFTLTMPAVEGEYHVFVNVVVAGNHLVLYRATESVLIVVTPSINIDFIGWQ